MGRNNDPTSTLSVRNRAIARVNKKFDKIYSYIQQGVKYISYFENNAFEDNAIHPRYYDSQALDKEIKNFVEWLRFKTFNELELGSYSDNWFVAYIFYSYKNGSDRARKSIRRFLKDNTSFQQTRDFSVVDARIRNVKQRPFRFLKNVDRDMAKEIKRILTEGMERGDGIKKIVSDLRKQVEISKVRARLIARTEIIRGSNLAVLQEARALKRRYPNRTVRIRWIHSLLSNARPDHKALHNSIMSISKAYGLIGAYNCRCSVAIHLNRLV